ncbi:MAG TPA: bifunctional (p)ppGpp synthetase/guanosine-3',5'-bis(diphosphate) 3'-pyrophosphohydrolase [Desulfurivibrio alkaliphilus]|uniref:Bifunctional (P)ppGpp synthetase/guanosine-3',5'-bis(Diphosphate) 3'-pyrophosphohydrolase n=1 Tax=Desulfurivibrio alkaliphilus TaxID=427923 RepID=A0A7C2TGY0_9BACT|nr:bifunctional (p)ppGpp synthetase/guanosine-3',5'-bis(diphosphate) 3'-pyrophosphohydrolase [Desulfurivibrio alkaliphilus]
MHNTIAEIIRRAAEYMPDEDLAPLSKAYAFAEKVHGGRHRLSGKPYLQHVLAVAGILVAMRLDVATITAGLLHGVLKQKEHPVSQAKLKEEFGEDVANIVAGATRITAVQFNSRLAYQAENIRKMLLAMASDIRVLLVRLADRLHDMQSINVVDRELQVEIAQETMDLYAPLAGRLGIDWIKRELEDLSFAQLHPEEYRQLAASIQTSLPEREAYVERVKEHLSRHLRLNGLESFRILGRPKHLYSIQKKLLVQNITLDKVYDKVAFRIIVHDVKECYQALGIIHSLWAPIDGRFKDFISHPKANGYQSVHTSVIGPDGDFMEIQIRTEDMDRVAAEGIAAHWAYKEGRAASARDVKLFKWLKQLVAMLQELEDPRELLDTVKGELYEDDIYVLTPNGEVKGFPKGSTPLDFAYSIHTEVGHHCSGAKVNGQITPLRTPLKNGDVVEIITSPNQKPGRNWLHIVKTSRARNRIRQWLNQKERERNLEKGREICERELRKHDISLKKLLRTGHLKEVLKKLSCNSLDDLMHKVGAGKLPMVAILRLLQPEELRREELAEEQAVLTQFGSNRARLGRGGQGKEDIVKVEGVAGIPTKIANCCLPVPGDEIIGFITTGRGITVHKSNCPNLLAGEAERRIGVSWSGAGKIPYRASVQALGLNRKGLLAALSSTITNDDADIASLEANTAADGGARFNMVLEVEGIEHLNRILQHIRQLEGISDAFRN